MCKQIEFLPPKPGNFPSKFFVNIKTKFSLLLELVCKTSLRIDFDQVKKPWIWHSVTGEGKIKNMLLKMSSRLTEKFMSVSED